MDLVRMVHEVRDEVDELIATTNQPQSKIEVRVAKEKGFSGRINFYKANAIVESGRQDLIDNVNNYVFTIDKAFKKLQTMPGKYGAANDKRTGALTMEMEGLYEKISYLEAENLKLRNDPSPSLLEKEMAKRESAEKALSEMRRFVINHPSGFNGEAIKFSEELKIVQKALPNADDYHVDEWRTEDVLACRSRISLVRSMLNKLEVALDGVA